MATEKMVTSTTELTYSTIFARSAQARPTTATWTWRHTSSGSDKLVIREGSGQYCEGCEYVIGVYGWNTASTYNVMANSGECMMTLYDGRPQVSPRRAKRGAFLMKQWWSE